MGLNVESEKYFGIHSAADTLINLIMKTNKCVATMLHTHLNMT